MKSVIADIQEKINDIANNGLVEISRRPDFSDLQYTGALRHGKNAMDVATEIASKLAIDGVTTTVIKPGFINFILSDEKLIKQMSTKPFSQNGNSLLIDYGGPNIAKTMHIGHLRSSVIGFALSKMAKYVGYDVTTDIHLGDFGHHLGLILALIDIKSINMDDLTISIMGELYREARTISDDSFILKAHQKTFEFQNHVEPSWSQWKRLKEISIETIRQTMDRLGVSFDQWNGESNHTQLPIDGTVGENGEVYYPFEDSSPLMLKNSHGCLLYGATDIATLYDRCHYDHVWYVVDYRQSLHFNQLFCIAKTALSSSPFMEHIAFGTINGPDGKSLKTRAGNAVELHDVLDMTVAAVDVINPTNSEIVGVGAVKLFDLFHDRKSDYIFDINAVTNFNGKSGPYLMYTACRAKSILNKSVKSSIIQMNSQIRPLCVKIAMFDIIVERAVEQRSPHILTNHLYDMAVIFNGIVAVEHIKDNPPMVALTEKFLETFLTGMDLLGITVPESM